MRNHPGPASLPSQSQNPHQISRNSCEANLLRLLVLGRGGVQQELCCIPVKYVVHVSLPDRTSSLKTKEEVSTLSAAIAFSLSNRTLDIIVHQQG
jgi:hypothetical protein